MHEKLKKAAWVYTIIENDPGLRWLDKNYGPKLRPLEEYADIKRRYRNLTLSRNLILILLGINLLACFHLTTTLMWDPIGLERFGQAHSVLGGLGIFAIGMLALFFCLAWSTLADAWVEVEWTTSAFVKDVSKMVSACTGGGPFAHISWLSANGRELSEGWIPEHVKTRCTETLIHLCKLTYAKAKDVYIDQIKVEAKTRFELFKRFGILAEEDRIKRFYDLAKQDLDKSTETHTETANP